MDWNSFQKSRFDDSTTPLAIQLGTNILEVLEVQLKQTMSSNDGHRQRHVHVQDHEQVPSKEEVQRLSSPSPPTSISLQKFIRDCLTPEYHGRLTSNFYGEKGGNNRPYSHIMSSNSHLYSSPPRIPFSLQEEREQALRDYKVTIEYKHLKSHAPGGVYLVPSKDNLRHFFGVIFVRRGPFTNGIFKFSLKLPPKYNDTDMWPQIVFSSRVYNPYVIASTGELDIQSAYPTWDPSRHYLVTVLTYLKKIFYSKNFADARANPEAREMAEKDPESYRKMVDECVRESQKKIYINEEGSTVQFTEEQVSHRVLRDLLKHHISNENQVTKQAVLAQVEKARKV
jgi:ubiquitin-protein ligase